MDDASQKLLHAFLQKATDGLPVIESFLNVRDSRHFDLSSMEVAFRSACALEEASGAINASSVRNVVVRVKDVLGKHLASKSCPTQAEYDALDFALEKIPVLIDCFKSSSAEPPGLPKAIFNALDIAEAFSGRPVIAATHHKKAVVDPFEEDAVFDFFDSILTEASVDQERGPVSSAGESSAPTLREIAADPFADDYRFGLSASRGELWEGGLRGVLPETLSFDPFADDPDF